MNAKISRQRHRVPWALATTAVLSLVATTLGATPAQASCNTGPGGDGQIFIVASASGTVRGQADVILLNSHVLDSSCSAAQTTATAHFESCSYICGTFIEDGYEYTSTGYKSFTEKALNYHVTDNKSFPNNYFYTGSWVKYLIIGKVDPTGGMNWDMVFNPLNGTGNQTMSTYHTDWAGGFAFGEAEIFGSGTAINTSQKSLQKYKPDGTWKSWAGMVCSQTSGPVHVTFTHTQTSFDTMKGGPAC